MGSTGRGHPLGGLENVDAALAIHPEVRDPRRWSRLLHRVFAIQILACDRCSGPRRILGAVTEPHAVRQVLAALGLAAEPPPGHAGGAA